MDWNEPRGFQATHLCRRVACSLIPSRCWLARSLVGVSACFATASTCTRSTSSSSLLFREGEWSLPSPFPSPAWNVVMEWRLLEEERKRETHLSSPLLVKLKKWPAFSNDLSETMDETMLKEWAIRWLMTTPFSTGVTKLSKEIERILFSSNPLSFSILFVPSRREKERERERVKYCLEYRGNFLRSRRETIAWFPIRTDSRTEPIENCLKLVWTLKKKKEEKEKRCRIFDFWKKDGRLARCLKHD